MPSISPFRSSRRSREAVAHAAARASLPRGRSVALVSAALLTATAATACGSGETSSGEDGNTLVRIAHNSNAGVLSARVAQTQGWRGSPPVPARRAGWRCHARVPGWPSW